MRHDRRWRVCEASGLTQERICAFQMRVSRRAAAGWFQCEGGSNCTSTRRSSRPLAEVWSTFNKRDFLLSPRGKISAEETSQRAEVR